MFLGITINNIRVAFLCFILGLLGSLGTIVILFYNGIMVGAFQYFFYSKGLFVESFLTIWIHGTIEISAIIIAGSAGIILGNGLLFPKTYSRGDSLQIAAKRAVRIIVGTIPLFILAGFLESFITRLTDLPNVIKVLIIGLSALYILGMYVIYPRWYYKNNKEEIDNEEIIPNRVEQLSFNKTQKRSIGENLSIAFSLYRTNFGRYIKHVIVPVLIVMTLVLYVYDVFFYAPSEDITSILPYSWDYHQFFDYSTGSWIVFVALLILIGFAFMVLNMIYQDTPLNIKQKLKHIKFYLPIIILIIALPVATYYFFAIWWIVALLLVVPFQIFVRLTHESSKSGWVALQDLSRYASLSYKNYFPSLIGFVVTLFLHYALILVVYSQLGQLIFDFISWHDLGETTTHWTMIARSLLYLLMTLLVLPLYYYSLMNFSLSIESSTTAADLWDRYIVLLFILLVNSLLLHNTAFAQSNDKDDIYRMSEERKSELSDVIKYDETTRKLRPKNQAKKKPKKRTPRKTKKRTDWSAAGDIASIFLYAGIAILVLVVLFTVFSNVKLDKKIEDPALLNLEDIEDIETIDAKTGLEIALEAENYREAVKKNEQRLLTRNDRSPKGGSL